MLGTSNASLAQWLDELLSESVESAKERARATFDAEIAPFQKRIVLLGAGNMGRQVLACLRQDGIEPLAFSDNNSGQWGKTIDGLDILPPKEAALRYGSNAAFVVTIYNNRHSFPDTRNQLTALGCKKVISVISLRWKYHERFLPYYRDDLPYKVLLQGQPIREAFEIWTDEASRREFVAQVAWRLDGNFDPLGTPDFEGGYFPRDVARFTQDEFFVDIGAYDGDTIQRFLDVLGHDFRRILALEPDHQNFDLLTRYVAKLPERLASKITPLPLAASNRNCRLRFMEGAGTSAALSEGGSVEVEAIRLDDLLSEDHPTYIKMDIEGAELDAIEGCRRIIAEDRPMLAICAYHVQDHLWKIPNLVNRIGSRNDFFLRPHMHECWETVVYVIPQERRHCHPQIEVSPSRCEGIVESGNDFDEQRDDRRGG
jgi:FkbM family methyltransferase